MLKHGILRRYLHVFTSKTGSASPDGRVAYLDGYSGPGEYADGTPGSPMLAAETASVLGRVRALEGFYVEKDRATFEHLEATLRSTTHRFKAFHGDIEEHLDQIMEAIGRSPLFAFFDPFGLGVPSDVLTEKILGRRRGPGDPATELLINFSLPGLRRNAGHLTSSSTDPGYLKARVSLIERVDRTLGGDWWHSVWETGADDREQQIVHEYVERLRRVAGGSSYAVIGVANRWDGTAVYCLIFLTSFPGALWVFNNALSSAMEDFRRFAHEFHSMMDLDPLHDREARWVDVIERNVRMLLKTEGAFTVGRRIDGVLGDMFGFAREKHVRRALKRLCEQDVARTEVYDGERVRTGATGDVEKMRVFPFAEPS